MKTELQRLITPNDGYMERGLAVRNNENIDIGFLFIDKVSSNNLCGRVNQILADPNNAFLAINVNCIEPIGSVITHEFGHLAGARHDDLTHPYQNNPFSYGHGYIDTENNLSTIMAYPCPNCEWQNVWSDPGNDFERSNIVSGTVLREDNSRVLTQVTPYLASLKGDTVTYISNDTTPPVISITLPTINQVLTSDSVRVVGTITEDKTTIVSLTIQLNSNPPVPLSISNSFNHVFNNISEGYHTIKIESINSNNLLSQKTVSFSYVNHDTIIDTIPPVIHAPSNITSEATGILTSVNIGTATATDNIDSTPTITNDAPLSFPLGDTIIIWTATDDSNIQVRIHRLSQYMILLLLY